MGFPLHVVCCFSLIAFDILSLCLTSASLISMCLEIFLLRFVWYGALCASWTCLTISFSSLGKISTLVPSKLSPYCFFLSSSSGTPMVGILIHLILSQISLRVSSVLFLLFTLFCSLTVISSILPSSLLILSSASDSLLLTYFRMFLISIVMFFFLCKFILQFI